jgi:hypothetical protein
MAMVKARNEWRTKTGLQDEVSAKAAREGAGRRRGVSLGDEPSGSPTPTASHLSVPVDQSIMTGFDICGNSACHASCEGTDVGTGRYCERPIIVRDKLRATERQEASEALRCNEKCHL